MEGLQFNPLNEQAFSNSVLYVDTNVLLMRFQSALESAPLFDEMIAVAKRLGIELRITRATINEARRVISSLYSELKKVLLVYPKEILERSNDLFLQSYLHALERNPDLTPEKFIEPFDRLSEVCEQEIGLVVDDRDESQFLNGRDLLLVAQIMQEEAKLARGDEKSPLVLEHDLYHFALVQDERERNVKTWFLTRDRTLPQVSSRLKESQPFCYSLIGFLQSISPFLSMGSEEHSFADVFSGLLTEQVFPIENTFEMRDMRLLYEYHSDLVSLPTEELVLAWDYLSQVVLKGQHYAPSEAPKVALELRKFISASADEKHRMLSADKERLESERASLAAEKSRVEGERDSLYSQADKARTETETERRARLAAEADRDQWKAEATDLRGQITGLAKSSSEQVDQISVRLRKEQQTRRRDYMLTGFAASILLWVLDDRLVSLFTERLSVPSEWQNSLRTIVDTVAAIIFSWPSLPFIRNLSWSIERRIALFSCVVMIALVFSRLLDNKIFSAMATVVSIAMLIATFFFYSLSKKQDDDNQTPS